MNSSIIRRDRNPITEPMMRLYAIAYIAYPRDPRAEGKGCFGASYMLARTPEEAAEAGLSRALYDLPVDEFFNHEATAVQIDTTTINQVAQVLQQQTYESEPQRRSQQLQRDQQTMRMRPESRQLQQRTQISQSPPEPEFEPELEPEQQRTMLLQRRERKGRPVMETRTLSEPVAQCGVAKCHRSAVEYDAGRRMYVCIVHTQNR